MFLMYLIFEKKERQNVEHDRVIVFCTHAAQSDNLSLDTTRTWEFEGHNSLIVFFRVEWSSHHDEGSDIDT